MKILAVDYGDARTGLAVCDATELLTTPITPQIQEKSMNKVAQQIVDMAKEKGCEQILIGLPRNMDGTEGSRAAKSRRLGSRIQDRCDIPIFFWDERRTTITAAAILSGNDVYGAKRKERLDSVSAAVILESYLDWRRLHPGEVPAL